MAEFDHIFTLGLAIGSMAFGTFIGLITGVNLGKYGTIRQKKINT